MWFVYMLLCDEKIYYLGITNNLADRFIQHKNRKSFFTKKFSKLKLVYCEEYLNKQEAARHEQQVKGWSRAKKQMLINGNLGRNVCTERAEVILANGLNM